MVVGHDQGEHLAVYAAIVRPDMFPRLTTISSAGGAPPSFPFEHRHRRNNAYPPTLAEQLTFSGRTIDVPAQFIAGQQDWGANRTPGGAMGAGKSGFTKFRGVQLVEGAGHWPHEEQPDTVSRQLVGFLQST